MMGNQKCTTKSNFFNNVIMGPNGPLWWITFYICLIIMGGIFCSISAAIKENNCNELGSSHVYVLNQCIYIEAGE